MTENKPVLDPRSWKKINKTNPVKGTVRTRRKEPMKERRAERRSV